MRCARFNAWGGQARRGESMQCKSGCSLLRVKKNEEYMMAALFDVCWLTRQRVPIGVGKNIFSFSEEGERVWFHEDLVVYLLSITAAAGKSLFVVDLIR